MYFLKFIAYKDGKVAKDFSLSCAYVFGADSVPLRGDRNIRCTDGVVEFDARSNETAGLSLMWAATGFGNIQLCTTRLLDRPEPYILNLELARAKLMQIVVKREEWSLFDGNDKIAAFAHQAQGHFIEALKVINNPAKASVLADRSLRKALIFSERLAARNADFYLAARCKNKGLGRHSLGCKINPDLLVSEKYRKRLFEMFCFVTIPVNWAQIEPEQGKFDFSSVDKILEYFSGRRLAVCAGPLLYFNKDHLPGWLTGSDIGFEKIRESAYKFVTEIIGRYYGKIHAWQVISGINAVNCLDFNFEQIMEMTRTACLAARTADPKSKSRKIVEILQPWGEYYAEQKDAPPPMVYADMVVQNSIPIDAFGVKMHFGTTETGCQVRDMMQISSKLDCFSTLGKPLHVTGTAIPGNTEKGTGAAGGVWHKPWSPQVQAEWIEQFYKIALGKSFIQSVTYSALADSPANEICDCGLVDESLEMKKAYMSLGKLQKVILKK